MSDTQSENQTENSSETLNFQTEAKQLLQLMIHSLYSNREIFLRELISNASDAIDKLRFRAIEDASLLGDDADFRIDVTFDKDEGTLTIADNGIGMSREDVIAHLGTIAKSGTAEFLANLTGDQKSDSQLIGQFGVGSTVPLWWPTRSKYSPKAPPVAMACVGAQPVKTPTVSTWRRIYLEEHRSSCICRKMPRNTLRMHACVT